MRSFTLLAAVGAAVFLALPLGALADTGTFEAHLRPNRHLPHASGLAEFDHNPYHDTLTLTVTVQNAAPLTTAAVVIDGNVVGSFNLDHTGSGHFGLSSLHGDEVPDLGQGDKVAIVDAHTGAVLLKGKFGPANP
jgi:hypothetical protein